MKNYRIESLKNIFYALVLLCIFVALSSCVSTKNNTVLDKVYVTNTKTVNVLPLSYYGDVVDDVVLLTVKTKDESFNFVTYLQSDESSIYLSIMNDFGVEMGSLYYDGVSVDLNCDLFPKSLKGVYLVNDIQNIFYSSDAVRENLEASKLDFTVDIADNSVTKRIMNGSKVVEEIKITDNVIILSNLLRGYEYSITFTGSN